MYFFLHSFLTSRYIVPHTIKPAHFKIHWAYAASLQSCAPTTPISRPYQSFSKGSPPCCSPSTSPFLSPSRIWLFCLCPINEVVCICHTCSRPWMTGLFSLTERFSRLGYVSLHFHSALFPLYNFIHVLNEPFRWNRWFLDFPMLLSPRAACAFSQMSSGGHVRWPFLMEVLDSLVHRNYFQRRYGV